MNEIQFEGKSAIVTGGTRGIGRAIVLELARRGADVAFNYSKSADEAEKLKAEIEAMGVRAFAAQCDVADTAASAEFVGQVKEAFGTVDFLVNNAGITRDQLILRMKEEDWDAVIDTNLKGAWNFSKAVIRPMMKNENGGSILNISSISGVVGMLGQSNYSASKAGVIGMTRTLAAECGRRGVTVNAMSPGFMATAMTNGLTDQRKGEMLERFPIPRVTTTAEVARSMRFFLESDYMTGQVISIDGGISIT